jgi:1,4-dihydroxy-2-naphthoate octaprenyltransferase
MSKIKTWLLATRPKTLPASIIPVLVGSAIAARDGFFEWYYLWIILACAILIQIITNFFNEYYDYLKGADTKERLGPQRAVAAGLISPGAMKVASIALLLITFALGMLLVMKAGLLILVIGIFSLFFAWGYTGGPLPLAYKGLGDIFVLIFFGIIAVNGTYYVFAESFSEVAFIAGFAPGIFSMNILSVNNIRDIETDQKAGKITMAVRLGAKKSKMIFVVLNLLAFSVSVILSVYLDSIEMLYPLATLPLSMRIIRNLYIREGKALNKVLAQTGLLLMIHGIVMVAAFLIPA